MKKIVIIIGSLVAAVVLGLIGLVSFVAMVSDVQRERAPEPTIIVPATSAPAPSKTSAAPAKPSPSASPSAAWDDNEGKLDDAKYRTMIENYPAYGSPAFVSVTEAFLKELAPEIVCHPALQDGLYMYALDKGVSDDKARKWAADVSFYAEKEKCS